MAKEKTKKRYNFQKMQKEGGIGLNKLPKNPQQLILKNFVCITQKI
jgi:hypothetical protein